MPILKAGGTSALNLSIRRATVADIPVLMALEKDAATAAHWSIAQYQAVFSGEGLSTVALVAEQNVVQGFIIGRVLDDEWEIENVVVAVAARRRGLGQRLVGEFLDVASAREAKSIFLEVRESNLAARRLYEAWAFIEAGRRKSYYREPEEDAILYKLQPK